MKAQKNLKKLKSRLASLETSSIFNIGCPTIDDNVTGGINTPKVLSLYGGLLNAWDGTLDQLLNKQFFFDTAQV